MQERCPYCEDYEDLKEELEKARKDSEKETKSSLEKCECEKKKLKKQLLTIGTAVVVGGTLIGKDFIDKVASYLKSFNSIKESGSSLISQNQTTSSTMAKVDGWDLPDLTNPADPVKYIPSRSYNIDFFSADLLTKDSHTYTLDLDTFSDLELHPSISLSSELNKLTLPIDNSWNTFDFYPSKETGILINPALFKSPIEFDPYIASPVPGPSALVVLAMGILFLNKRRRK